MDALLEQFLENYLNGVYGEGERILRIKALSVCIRAIQGTRKILILNHLAMLSCFVWALSFFASAFLLVTQLQETHAPSFQPTLIFCLALLGLSTLAGYLIYRERTWIEALGLQTQLKRALRAPRSRKATPQAPNEIDTQALADLIEKILDKKLAKQEKKSA